MTSLVGRRRELGDIRRALSTARLLTLTGPGGVGKTRLAVRIAGQVRRSFADGVWLVELAALQDPALLVGSVEKALGIVDSTGDDPVEVLVRYLADRQLLLVVDNCEHLVSAVAQLAVELLRVAPGLRMLTTSREALQVPGEYLYPVAPLPVPTVDRPAQAATVVRSAAAALFAERAAAVVPGFAVTDDNAAVVAALCLRLDGMPLAIELAAARLTALSLNQLTERLDDRFRLLTTGNRAALPRHQTLQAAVAWSFDLCIKPERLLWTRAAVFAGSFDVAAAEAVCGGDGLPAGDVLETLSVLIAKSVLTAVDGPDGRRYRMLDSLRQFGLERLRGRADLPECHRVEEAELCRRHRDFYLARAEAFHADWFGPHQVAWSARMRADLANLRAALGYCLASTDRPHAGVRLAGALHYLWYACGQVREGRLWLERTLAADPDPTWERMRALAALMRLAILQGRAQAAAVLAEECLDAARRFGESAVVVESMIIAGFECLYRRDVDTALPLLEGAVALAERLPADDPELAYATVALALAASVAGDVPRAGALFARSRAVCRARGDRWYLAVVQLNAAMQALAASDLAGSAAYAGESLELCVALGDTSGASAALDVLAWVAAAGHDYPRTAWLLGAAERQRRSVDGSPLDGGPIPRRQEAARAARAALGDAAFEANFRHGHALPLDSAVDYALGHEGLPVARHDTRPDRPVLTRRQRETAELVAQGLSNRQIADRLMISQRTVESHVENILARFGFTSRSQIVVWQAEQGGNLASTSVGPDEAH